VHDLRPALRVEGASQESGGPLGRVHHRAQLLLLPQREGRLGGLALVAQGPLQNLDGGHDHRLKGRAFLPDLVEKSTERLDVRLGRRILVPVVRLPLPQERLALETLPVGVCSTRGGRRFPGTAGVFTHVDKLLWHVIEHLAHDTGPARAHDGRLTTARDIARNPVQVPALRGDL
jgi:hypothetical protein